MARAYVGRHRLIKSKNLTLRATLAATVAVIAMVLLAMSSGPRVSADPGNSAPPALAGPETSWEHAVQQIHAIVPTTAAAVAGADSGRKQATQAGALRKASFRLETCDAEG